MVGIDPRSEGLRRAQSLGFETTSDGVDWLLRQQELPRILFDATSAYAHRLNAPRYEEAGIQVVDSLPLRWGRS